MSTEIHCKSDSSHTHTSDSHFMKATVYFYKVRGEIPEQWANDLA